MHTQLPIHLRPDAESWKPSGHKQVKLPWVLEQVPYWQISGDWAHSSVSDIKERNNIVNLIKWHFQLFKTCPYFVPLEAFQYVTAHLIVSTWIIARRQLPHCYMFTYHNNQLLWLLLMLRIHSCSSLLLGTRHKAGMYWSLRNISSSAPLYKQSVFFGSALFSHVKGKIRGSDEASPPLVHSSRADLS